MRGGRGKAEEEEATRRRGFIARTEIGKEDRKEGGREEVGMEGGCRLIKVVLIKRRCGETGRGAVKR